MRIRRPILASVIALAVVILATYFAAGEIPALTPPVHVERAAFYADGGSFHLVLRDAGGLAFAVGVSGSLDTPRSDFPLYTQRWWPYFPVPALVRHGSSAEVELSKAVQRWLAQPELGQNDRIALLQLGAVLQERTRAR